MQAALSAEPDLRLRLAPQLLGTFLQFLMNRLEHVLVRWKARAKPASLL